MTVADGARRAALWIAVAIGFSIPISTALDNLLVAALLLCWLASGAYREKLGAIRDNPFALAAIGVFLLYVAGAAYSIGSRAEVLAALDKASTILLIPVMIALNPGQEFRQRALYAFMAAMLLTLALSILIWLGVVLQSAILRGLRHDPSAFRNHITHGVLMAFAALVLALASREAAKPASRVLRGLLAGIAAFNVLFMVQGRTGQLVLLALLFYGFVRWFRWRGVLAGAAAVLAIGGIVTLTPSSALHQRVLTSIAEFENWRAGKPATPANVRLEAWSNSLEIVRRHPLIGVGTGGFAAAYARQVQGTAMVPQRQPENEYFLTTVQLGFVGLAALVALFAYQWRLAARLATRMDTDLARGLVLTMAVGCLFNSFLRDHTEALFYAWLSGLLYAGLRPAAGRG